MENYRQVIRQSVQDLPNAREGDVGSSAFWSLNTERGFILPRWATRDRERTLRLYYRHEYNWMAQAAFAGLAKKVKSASWEISGKQRVTYFQDVLRQANFGKGWGDFVSKVVLDFLRQDGGAYIEIIAPGNPLKAPTGAVTGIASLDSLRCYPTGDPEYPVIYYSRKGAQHLMHHTRVRQLVDMADGDESNPGYGLCALSRGISIVSQQIHAGRYIEAKLDDKPQPGIMVASGITKPTLQQAYAQFQTEQRQDDMPPWGRSVILPSMDVNAPIKVDWITFSQAPEGWSYKEYTELWANAWALVLGVDVQELWQLTGGSLGSGAQSQVLHAKSQGRTFGDLLKAFERGMNDILPESLEFEFKVRDPYESQERAQTAALWAGFVSTASATLSAEEARQLLANQVEAYKDAVTDANGEIRRLDDVDPQAEEDTTVDDATPQDTGAQAKPTEATTDDTKDYATTRGTFERGIRKLIDAARDDDATRRQLGAGMRSIARRSGLEAINDAFTQAGYPQESLSSDMLTQFRVWEKQTSEYITKFGAELFSEGGISDSEVPVRVQMWANKTLDDIFYAAYREAAPFQLATWHVDPVKEHCKTCIGREGMTKTMDEWGAIGFPHDSRLDCGGWLCGCWTTSVDGTRIGVT